MTNNKELINQIKSLKAIKPSADWREKNRRLLLRQINSEAVSQSTFDFQDYLRFFVFKIPRLAAKPVGIIMLVISVVLGSSVAMVGAASNSLPGDYLLYTVKIATETVQSNLVTDPQDKVFLEIEFANRRVNEIKRVSLKSESTEKKQKRANEAVNQFKDNLQSVQNNLDTLKKEDPVKVVATANLVDMRVEELNKVVKEDMAKDNGIKDVAKEVKKATEETATKALDIMVGKHNEADSDVKGAIEQKVNDKISQAQDKVVTLSTALEKEASAAEKSEITKSATAEQTQPAAVDTSSKEAKKALDEAQISLNKGDLTAAVEKLKEGKKIASAMEDQVQGIIDDGQKNSTDNKTECKDGKCVDDYDTNNGSGVSSTTSSTAADINLETELASQTAEIDTGVKTVGDQMEVATETIETENGEVLLNKLGE